MKTKLLSLFVALFAATNLFAADFEKDGIAYKILTENTVEVTSKSSGYSGSVVIPETVTYNNTTYSVTTIGSNVFNCCFDLTSVTIGNSVTTIGSYAFYKCISLTSIIIPNSVTTLEHGAFLQCSGLTSITIPNSVTTIAADVFSDCTSLPVIDNIRYADTYLIEAVDKTLSTYTIKAGTKWIGSYAFYNCTSLTSIIIPDFVTAIEYGAFYGSGLRDVRVAWTSSDQLPTMGNDVFTDIANLNGPSAATLHVPEGTKSIYEATDQWKDFGTITDERYDSEVSVITYTATKKLTSSYLEVGWTTFGPTIISHTFSNGTGTITCSGKITTIEEEAFAYCSDLTSITIPYSVTTIDGFAFYGSGLRDVRVAWTSRDQLPTMEDYVFNSIAKWDGPSAATLHVPKGTKSIYEAADQWKDFGTILDGVTALPNVLMHGSQPTMRKYFHNGNLIIERNGVKYTATGQKVR